MSKLGENLCSALKRLYMVQARKCYGTAQIAQLQEAALDERCILVDHLDRPIGEASKRHCHKVSEDGSIPLHRAFSVFLFNQAGDLLLQKRSSSKITFPNHYTNTCCSHPLAEIPGETVEEDALGIKRAAQRRLEYELGIPSSEIQPRDFVYLTRIHYQAAGVGEWGEHEIDYVLFIQKDNITLHPNSDEISEVCWVSQSQIEDFVQKIDSPLSPWFLLILKHRLSLWWNNLNSLYKVQDHKTIQKF